eukprot:1386641-Amorphochlora_amoeboformis.AAC.1
MRGGDRKRTEQRERERGVESTEIWRVGMIYRAIERFRERDGETERGIVRERRKARERQTE